jgi:hypothetical protein
LASLEYVDHVIVDPPYSARTHNGHNKSSLDVGRRCLTYKPWGAADVLKACSSFELARGWIVVMTDHVLAPCWEAGLKALGRYVFAPLPCVLTGSRVRMSGDGPSSWTTWLVVARTTSLSRWGTLRGAYVMSRGERTYMGGKPLHLMDAIVRDYSRPGDIICDPCAGSGSTGVAALRAGRRFVGWEHNIDAFAVARKALKAA